MTQDFKKYWKGLEERDGDPVFLQSLSDEFPGEPDWWLNAPLSARMDRRSFLKLTGFGLAVVSLAGCGRHANSIISHIKPEENNTPGKSCWFATTCVACSAACGMLVKTREGRPVKMEGNNLDTSTGGGLCAVGQAGLLELYDSLALRHPVRKGRTLSWEEVDADIVSRLKKLKEEGKEIAFLSQSIVSPALRRNIQTFLAHYGRGRHVQYDSLSCSAILDAHKTTHGLRVLPHYCFENAKCIVSLDADFLGTWISPVEFTNAWRKGRNLVSNVEGHFRFSHLLQVESRLSLTGSKADQRLVMTPGDLQNFALHLAQAIQKKAGSSVDLGLPAKCPVPENKILDIADRLWRHRGESLIVCGHNNRALQTVVNLMNHLLGNYERTLSIQEPSFQKQGDDAALMKLLEDMNANKIGALFLHGANPLYELPNTKEFSDALKKTGLVVSFGDHEDESAEAAEYLCPDLHYLESWGDAEPVAGRLRLSQPTLNPLGDGRSVLESLHAWMEIPKKALEILQNDWREHVHPRSGQSLSFQQFWDQSLHDGVANIASLKQTVSLFSMEAVQKPLPMTGKSGGHLALQLHTSLSVLDGRHAHNPWLLELPDPITKVTWDNVASISSDTANAMRLKTGDVVRIEDSSGNQGLISLEIPVLVQPGQANDCVALTLGWGRKGTDRFSKVGPQWLEGKATVAPGEKIGVRVSDYLLYTAGSLAGEGRFVKVEKTGRSVELACTQTHHSLSVPEKLAPKNQKPRPFVQEAVLSEYEKDPHAGSHHGHKVVSLWKDDHDYKGRHWAMAIDLSACTGCSACVVSCQSENNIPVVGKDEVRRGREMHWMRIDRYFSESEDGMDVAHQPMLCQHCDNAPCEAVCPVLATVHSSEGLNQQVYNRCVGTRYCANNCPYKVRRFNWFDYRHDDKLQNLALNPDIVVRSRGVMEKCSFCVQRIQEAGIEARRQGRDIRDGDVQTACQQSCPAKAIVFGDVNDPDAEIAKTIKDPRSFQVLDELNVRPSVYYQRLIRNRESSGGGGHHE